MEFIAGCLIASASIIVSIVSFFVVAFIEYKIAELLAKHNKGNNE